MMIYYSPTSITLCWEENEIFRTIKSKLISLISMLITSLIFVGVFSIVILHKVNMKSTIISDSWILGTIFSEELNTMTSDFRILEYEHIQDIFKFPT